MMASTTPGLVDNPSLWKVSLETKKAPEGDGPPQKRV